MSPADGVDETSRSLGRIEQRLETMAERGEARDAKLVALGERQHKTANAVQGISGQVSRLQSAVDSAKSDMGDVRERLAALEAPIKRALAQRKNRRRFWGKVVSMVVFLTTGIWLVVQPVLKIVVDYMVAHFMGPKQ